ncbi:MAG TPA: hypothetical protein PLV92_04520 [Pirellulaceae bacterium]|nr:hypothetical protein [Pirellulaceae bacterium]
MWDFLQTPVASAVIWVTVLVALIAVAAFVVRKFRDRAVGDTPPASDLLSNFREMAQQGALSDTEYRTIKTMLGAKLHQELPETPRPRPERPDRSDEVSRKGE